ncbi:L,D-transpeptidase family protein [Microbacterium hydrocarbonoxydans]|uniref:L,D-transpeptidase family protein n=1 Tax=Microbacterium hydrocarbonoxydans TaxID=273678 RepID=UPI00203D3919|nr:L,D-transpeptidase family protein [Microbacterium hydrocarbonoxydans]MCM3779557.1 L,D-transpeptidase/peptidoglycan binding protein [Microbacterium hydrocarbonoxydans]
MKFVTDLISAQDAKTEKLTEAGSADTVALTPSGDETPTDSMPPESGDQPLAWAPIEPAPKKKRLGLWIGLGVGAVVIGVGAASMILIAPGTTVAGIPVGWMTPGAAADVISAHVSETEVTLTGAGDDVVLTGAELGAAVDASALADKAFAEHPMWNVGAWMGEPVAGEIALDPAVADTALRDAVPASFEDPVDAGVVFDAATGSYVITPSATGTGVDVAALNEAFIDTIAEGGKSFEFPGGPAEAAPAVTDEDATALATSINTMLGTMGFYLGEERTVPVDAATASTWFTVVDDDGTLRIEADQAAIQATVDALPAAVDRAPVNATQIVDSSGKVLRTESEGVNGRALSDTSNLASDVADKLEAGESVFPISVTETPFSAVTLLRKIDVNLSSQTATLYENGAVVRSWKISSGKAATPTDVGNFKVYAHVRSQTMKSREPDGSITETPNVPWVTYFNGDEGFHGTYWHSNFGNRMSHGCVNMPIDVARFVYEWSPVGMEVSVHN